MIFRGNLAAIFTAPVSSEGFDFPTNCAATPADRPASKANNSRLLGIMPASNPFSAFNAWILVCPPLRLVGSGICGKTFPVKSKLLACLGLLSSALVVVAQTSAFTYQGQFSSNGVPATGRFDFRFTLHNDLLAGTPVGSPLTNAPLGVTNGLFTTTLDFGSGVFDGNLRWLEIGVRTNGSATNEFNTLAPRQPITATPYAVRAANYSGPVSVTTLAGKINDTNLSANVALLTNNVVFTRNLTASNFTGSALGLTNIPATNLIGTLPDARLSTNVAKLNTSNAIFLGAISAANFYGNGDGITNVPGRIFEVIPTSVSINPAEANFGYLATNDSAAVVVTLPPTASIRVGETIRVSGIGAAGWIIAQNAGQTILAGNLLKNVGLVWRTNATIQNWKAVAASQDGQKLVAAVSTGFTYTSANAGLTWTPGSTSLPWSCVASSGDGVKCVAGVNGGTVYTSPSSGAGWSGTTAPNAAWSGVDSSVDGVKLVACVSGGDLWTSTTSGGGWSQRSTGATRNWTGVASSGDGVYLAACASGGQIWTSSNSGANWTARDAARPWSSIASSSDGGTLVACVNGGVTGFLYVSYDFGATWSTTGPATATTWSSVACSGDGLRMIAAVGTSGAVYVSQDAGATWQLRSNLPTTANYTGVACSGDGSTMVAVANGHAIYVSSQTSTTLGVAGQLIGSRLSAVELMHAGSGVFIPVSYVGNIRAK